MSGAAARAERERDAGIYRRMVLIRRFEEIVQRMFQKGEVHGTTHLYSGQEAGAVGVCDVLGDADRVAGTYRGHGHALALGVEPEALLAELMGRRDGVCRGRAGSMNVISLADRLIGCFGIVGGSIAAATGVALALQRQGEGGVAVAFFGEGTTNQAYFAECLNFAQVQRLPVVYVCENNCYAEFTPNEQVTAGEILARVKVLGMPAQGVDGMDAWAVRDAAQAAVAHARAGSGPAFVESHTYRYAGHSRSDPGTYRRPDELEEMKLRDPLLGGRARLRAAGLAEEALDAIEQEVAAAVEQAAERALLSPYPDPAELGSQFSDDLGATAGAPR